ESKNEYRAKGSPWSLQVVNCLRSGAHPSGPGSDDFCFLASCVCAVGKFAVGEFAVGKFMGRAPAAAVQSLWRLWACSPMGQLGLSPTGKGSFLPPQGTGGRNGEGRG